MRIVIYNIPSQEKVLYNLGQLLEKILINIVDKKSDIGIFCNSDFEKNIDDILWTFSTNIFLPHDTATGDRKIDDEQPILISSNLDLLNRKILCLFNDEDLFNVLSKVSTLDKVEHVIYMLQAKSKDDIKKMKKEIKEKNTNVCVDTYIKNDSKWVMV